MVRLVKEASGDISLIRFQQSWRSVRLVQYSKPVRPTILLFAAFRELSPPSSLSEREAPSGLSKASLIAASRLGSGKMTAAGLQTARLDIIGAQHNI